MDVTAARSNNNSSSRVDDKTNEPRRSPFRISRNSIFQIVSIIRSNPEPRIANSITVEELTSEINKLCPTTPKKQHIKSEGDLGIVGSINMKFGKKPDFFPKVSNSFPTTPGGVVKKNFRSDPLKHGTAPVNVRDIPLPAGDKPLSQVKKNCPETLVTLPSNRKIVFTRSGTEQFIEEKSSFPRRLDRDKTLGITTDISTNVPSKEQCSLLRTEQYELNTSLIDNVKSHESVLRQNHECPSQEDCETGQVDVSSCESSSAAEGEYINCTNKNDVPQRVVLCSSNVSVKKETAWEANQSEATPKYRYQKRSNDTSSDKKQFDTVQFPNFSTPPPTAEGSWRTPVTSRDRAPGKVCRSRSSVGDFLPWAGDRSRSGHHRGRSTSQEDQTQRTNQARVRIEDRRNFRGFDQNLSSKASSHFNNEEDPKNQGTKTIVSREFHFWRSSESLSQESQHGTTMARASSLESMSRSSESSQSIDRPSMFHLTPDLYRPHQQALSERNYGGACFSGRGYDENFSESFVPHSYNYTPPLFHSLSTSTLPLQETDDPLEPNMRGHQLLGDSQLLRFSKQILEKDNRSTGNMRYLGLCVSGQTIQELHHKIKHKFYPVGDRIILLIGTNNFLQNQTIDEMMTAWDELMSLLLSDTSRRLLLLTVPPIPKLADCESHWDKLKKFNTFIKGYAFGSKSSDDVRVADICPLFLADQRQCREDYFELLYSSQPPRTDMIHLNNRGFMMIRNYLLENNFL